MNSESSCAQASGISLTYRKIKVLDAITLDFPARCMLGLIGPDGVGKSSLLALIAGARKLQNGTLSVLGGDMRNPHHRAAICPRIAYMPQGLGKNLYPTLSVEENLQFFARLFGHRRSQRRARIDALSTHTGLRDFLSRPAGKLSGGMKQKLGLCCALIHDPDLLILDEPTTGVDPLSRRHFWDLIAQLREARPNMSVIVATAYMDEADQFDWLVAMDGGKILASGTPHELHQKTGTDSLEDAFIQLLPPEKKQNHPTIEIPAYTPAGDGFAIEAQNLSMRFGDFVAVDHVDFKIQKGEIFGFLGSNGCGKTTTMKVLTGLLPASAGNAYLFGKEVNSSDISIRRRVGYMSQNFSLYTELNVEQNLVLHARLFDVPPIEIPTRVHEMVTRFGLLGHLKSLPDTLPLGIRQRLSLAVAMVHRPELLILDEPTSGVDPIARDQFWQLMIDLARKDRVTIFISTHFMNEASRCDRISLMHAGKVLVSDSPAEIIRNCGVLTLEDAFIHHLKNASGGQAATTHTAPRPLTHTNKHSSQARNHRFSLARSLSYVWRESLELQRDPLRAALALLGTVLLMVIMGYGVSMDVENLPYAILDHDQSTLSHNYALNLAGSNYFVEAPPILNDADLDRRMRSGELALALEIPPNFARDAKRGSGTQIGAWVDGSMPQRAETAVAYIHGMHHDWLTQVSHQNPTSVPSPPVTIETRFRYNPDVKSLPAMVPAMIPILLMMIPAMLSALSVVREKELGSIVNLYVTPVTRTEFLLGKQIPYVFLGMLNFLLMSFLAVAHFGVPMKGSFPTLAAAAMLFVTCSTAIGLLVSVFTRSQIAAIFFTMIGTIIPALQFSGMIHPVSSLEGMAALIGKIYPATHFLTICRGVFNKALEFSDLRASFLPLILAIPVILGSAIALLKKQEG